ncbi:MAG TPA: family 1 encapsulin nanocompartment shell protein [Candidatus Obscuribacterales bacterium]
MWSEHHRLTELPLTQSQAEQMLAEAVKEVRRTIIGRRFIELYGPLGAGVESVPLESFRRDENAEIDLEGQPDPSPIGAHEKETYIRVPLIYKDFTLHWRNIKLAKDQNSPLDMTNAIRSAHQVAHREDDLIFNGAQKLGIKGLLNWTGVGNVKRGDWQKQGVPLADVYKAMDTLIAENHHYPYAIAMSLDMYESLVKSVKDSPVLELEQITKLCSDGVFYSQMIPPGTAVLVSTGVMNLDIAVAEDVHVAYLGPQDMNHRFRVYESLVLRVKRPKSICVIS